jgi:uncharacterized protein YciI
LNPRLYAEAGWTEGDRASVNEHFQMLSEGAKAGRVIVAGRTLDDFRNALGILIFEAADEAEARAFLEADPVVRAGVMSVELHPYRVAVSR